MSLDVLLKPIEIRLYAVTLELQDLKSLLASQFLRDYLRTCLLLDLIVPLERPQCLLILSRPFVRVVRAVSISWYGNLAIIRKFLLPEFALERVSLLPCLLKRKLINLSLFLPVWDASA